MLELFVSGNSFVSAGLAATMQSLGYSVGVYKPVQTGAIEKHGFIQSPDLAFVKSVDPCVKTYFTYLFKSNDLPIIASQKENTLIDKDVLYKDYKGIEEECIITDGTFGLSTPWADNFLEQDFVKMLNIPVLMVISQGSVNDILANINQAISAKVNVRGVIINNVEKTVPQMIEKYTDAKILGMISDIDKNIKPNDLITNILTGVDLESIFNVKISKLEF